MSDELTLKQKVAYMSGTTNEIWLGFESLILGHYNRNPYGACVDKSGRRLLKFVDGPRGCCSSSTSTCFPVAMARGATFDVELEEKVGQAMAKEVRSVGGNYFGGVCINILRSPLWGRAQETFSEDSYHLGEMGKALTRGVQHHNVMACIKHFALNNQENTRFKVDVTCSERTLREVYLPHFYECVVNEKAASVMGAYNKFRGDHCCHSQYLLRDILKKEWQFPGFVISDFNFGVRSTVKAANASCDVEMASTKYYGSRLVRAVKMGLVEENLIDDSVSRISSTIKKFEERPDPLPSYPASLRGCKEHVDLALEVAEKSMVLLKNDDVLPFGPEIKSVLVVGKLAKTENIGDHGSSRVHPSYIVTLFDGLKERLAGVKVAYSAGGKHARKIAAQYDAVIFCAGCTHSDEGEFLLPIGGFGGDRKSLSLHSKDIEMINTIAPLNMKSCVVLIGGSALMCEEWKRNVGSILFAFYPGMVGGTALANTLFELGDGKNNNPGGKLPFTIPQDEHHLAPFDREAKKVHYDYLHGYSLLDENNNMPAFAFGFGLSYTTFQVKDLQVEQDAEKIQASVWVKNTGSKYRGDEVVQLYVGFKDSKVFRAKKSLRGFKRVSLEPNQEQLVKLQCPFERLKFYNEEERKWELEQPVTYQVYIGTSSREQDLLLVELKHNNLSRI